MQLIRSKLDYQGNETTTTTRKFRDVQVGQYFDFIGPDRSKVSFHQRCKKVSARMYAWDDDCSNLTSRVGTIDVQVYHVSDTK